MSFLTDLVVQKIRSFDSQEAAADFFKASIEEIEDWNQEMRIPVSALEKVFNPDQIRLPCSEEALWKGKQVCILLPWYKSTNPVTAFSIMSMLDRAKMAVMLNFGDAFIAHTRNTLAEKFLQSNLEWALTVDDDMILPCGNAAWFNSFTGFKFPERFAGLHTVNRLLSHEKTLVGALYFGRWKRGKPVYAEGNQPNEEAFARRGPHDVCKPTKWVGTGCMLIHRTVFLDIEKNFPHLARDNKGNRGHWFTSSEHDLREASRKSLLILQDQTATEQSRILMAEELLRKAQDRSRFNSGLGMGEDVQFCVRATQSGHHPHVDLGLVCGHMGNCIFGPKQIP